MPKKVIKAWMLFEKDGRPVSTQKLVSVIWFKKIKNGKPVEIRVVDKPRRRG